MKKNALPVSFIYLALGLTLMPLGKFNGHLAVLLFPAWVCLGAVPISIFFGDLESEELGGLVKDAIGGGVLFSMCYYLMVLVFV